MSVENIELRVINILSSFEFCNQSDNGDDLFSDIESLNFMILISALENEFDYEFENEDLHPDNFKTINTITTLLYKGVNHDEINRT